MMTFMSQGDGEICYHHRDEGLASGYRPMWCNVVEPSKTGRWMFEGQW